jgi:transposase
MMGIHSEQKELFSYQVDLDARVPPRHPLRLIKENIDFSFARKVTAKCYGTNGHESVDPVIVLKLMFLLFYDNITSERKLMDTLPYRLDYLWFLGYGLDDVVPNHSVLSKARRRWGVDVFETLFAHTIAQCMDAGLVNGHKIHMDGSLINANASKNSVLHSFPEEIEKLRHEYQDEMNKLDDPVLVDGKKKYYKPKNKELLSTTDPDCEMVRHGFSESRPHYKTHRAIDDQCGIITAVETTAGGSAEAERLMPLVKQHESRTGHKVETVVADAGYGTVDNFKKCASRGIRSHMADVESKQQRSNRAKLVYDRSLFIYDDKNDYYICPAGHELTRRKHKKTRACYEYACDKKICAACSQRSACTKSKSGGRTIKRHMNQAKVEQGKRESASRAAKRDRVRRKWLMEGSFADATNHHLKRSRWRRLWRQQIQNLLIAAVQNIRKLISRPKWSPAYSSAMPAPTETLRQSRISTQNRLYRAFLRLTTKMPSQYQALRIFWSAYFPVTGIWATRRPVPTRRVTRFSNGNLIFPVLILAASASDR